jgi:hypothetical protein
VELSEAELALRRTEIVRDVKAGFFRVLASERLVAVSTQLVAVAESSAATARKRVDAGAAAYQEQLRAEVQLEQARTELTGFQREAGARQILVTFWGGRFEGCRLSSAAEAGCSLMGAGNGAVGGIRARGRAGKSGPCGTGNAGRGWSLTRT